jgi:hypothetical protein
MSYTATVNDPHQPDAMPMWESLDHATVDDAYRAAQTQIQIQATQPHDRIVDQGHGVYVVWTVDDAQLAIHVATLVIAPSGYVHADPARRSHQADNA